MRRTLASPNFATSSNNPPAICGEVLSASISTAKRGRRCCSAFITAPSVWVGGGCILEEFSLIPEKMRRYPRRSNVPDGRRYRKLCYLSVACEKEPGLLPSQPPRDLILQQGEDAAAPLVC